MGSETHPADEVVGGLWRCMLLRAVHDVFDPYSPGHLLWAARGEPAEVVECDGMLHIQCNGDARELTACSLSDWGIILDDPLGLGLAGLAARVAERLEPTGSNWLPEWLRALTDGPIRWDDLPPRDLCTVASALALTDRLCALVGLELADGEVAGLGLHEDEGEWFLMTNAGEGQFIDVYAEDTTDPLDALRAAVAMEAR